MTPKILYNNLDYLDLIKYEGSCLKGSDVNIINLKESSIKIMRAIIKEVSDGHCQLRTNSTTFSLRADSDEIKRLIGFIYEFIRNSPINYLLRFTEDSPVLLCLRELFEYQRSNAEHNFSDGYFITIRQRDEKFFLYVNHTPIGERSANPAAMSSVFNKRSLRAKIKIIRKLIETVSLLRTDEYFNKLTRFFDKFHNLYNALSRVARTGTIITTSLLDYYFDNEENITKIIQTEGSFNMSTIIELYNTQDTPDHPSSLSSRLEIIEINDRRRLERESERVIPTATRSTTTEPISLAEMFATNTERISLRPVDEWQDTTGLEQLTPIPPPPASTESQSLFDAALERIRNRRTDR
jgi:hypothetical protein